MHVVTILRYYQGLTQMELAEKSGVAFADINEMENKPAYGMIDKYSKVAKSLHVPVHTVAMNDILGVPETFFRQKRKVKYTDLPKAKNGHLGRLGGLGTGCSKRIQSQHRSLCSVFHAEVNRGIQPVSAFRSLSRGHDFHLHLAAGCIRG